MGQSNAAAAKMPASNASDFEMRTYRKVAWRILPLLVVCYLLAYLDRVNVGFAKLQMQTDLGLTETVYGLGAGIFFLGYFLFEVPSNVILHQVGARVWIARIMVTWGLVSAAMMFVTTPEMFYVMRFFLGVAEAGFFPGIILYLTYWYPAGRRARITAIFMTAVALSGLIGSPISGWIVQNLSGAYGLAGWQWLFLCEGLPTVLIGIVVLLYLNDSIEGAHWLGDDEKKLLAAQVFDERVGKLEVPIAKVLASPRVWLMSLIYFSFVMGLYGVSFWLPTIIKALGVSSLLNVGLLGAIPWGFASIAMVLVSRRADQMRERRWHIVVPALIGAVGLIISVVCGGIPVLAMIGLTLATMGILSTLPLFWSMPTAFLAGAGAAAGIALINSIGNLAGFISPFAVGWLKDLTHSTDAGMYLLAASMVLGAILTLCVPARIVNR